MRIVADDALRIRDAINRRLKIKGYGVRVTLKDLEAAEMIPVLKGMCEAYGFVVDSRMLIIRLEKDRFGNKVVANLKVVKI